MSWGKSVLLYKDERIVDSWKGVWMTIKEEAAGKEEKRRRKWRKVDERKEGYLVLTNRRLLFVNEENIMIDIPTPEVTNAWLDKVPLKVQSPKGTATYVFQLDKVGKKEFERFRELLSLAR